TAAGRPALGLDDLESRGSHGRSAAIEQRARIPRRGYSGSRRARWWVRLGAREQQQGGAVARVDTAPMGVKEPGQAKASRMAGCAWADSAVTTRHGRCRVWRGWQPLLVLASTVDGGSEATRGRNKREGGERKKLPRKLQKPGTG